MTDGFRLRRSSIACLDEAAATSPHLPALTVDGHGSITYGELHRRATELASCLSIRATGDRVVLEFDSVDWIEFAIAYFGVLMAGGVCVPIASDLTPDEVGRIVGAVSPRLLLRGTHTEIASPRAQTLASYPTSGRLHAESQRWEPMPVDPAQILLTSGTTAEPKLVLFSHEALTMGTTMPERRVGPLGVQLALLHAYQPGSFAGVNGVLLPQIAQRIHVISMPRFDPFRYLAILGERKVDLSSLTPSMALGLVEAMGSRPAPGPGPRLVWFSGSAVPAELLRNFSDRFPRTMLINVYGLTEAGFASTRMPYDPRRPEAIGRPTAGTEVRVMDADGEACAPGIVGEICLRSQGHAGPVVLQAGERTTSTSSWIRTGDLGYLDEAGYLYCTGRLKNIVVIGGRNVSTAEVEAALCTHPCVRDAAVVGVELDGIKRHEFGEELAAAVVTSGAVSTQELRRFLRQRLARAKIPRRLMLVDDLPRNRMGKVQYPKVRQMFQRGMAQG